MEGLIGYGSSDSGGEVEDSEESPQHKRPSVSINAAPDVDEPVPRVAPADATALPPVSQHVSGGQAGAAGQPQARWQSAAPQSTVALKRPSPSGQRAGQPPPPKAVRGSTLRRTPPQKGVLLPPQLRGRANVVTEDLERMGHKKQKTSGERER
mmetsp:Transcript_1427/g.4258  ORF Transcript_1427/g.4258 Transcript_1427/m.4258 type:complete len:153 (+) Transcript_1427:354-812(+)